MHIDKAGNDEVGQAITAFNSLMQSLQAALNDTNRVMTALVSSDFSQRIEVDPPGDLGALKQSVNASLDRQQATMAALNEDWPVDTFTQAPRAQGQRHETVERLNIHG